MHGIRLMLTALLALMAARLPAADWPNFRGPNHDGISTETKLNKDWAAKPPKVLWQTPMSDDGYAGPAVAGGRIFILDHKGADDVVRAIDVQSGSNAWTYSYPDNANANYGFARATPAVSQGRVFTLSRLGVANCLGEKDGKPLWSTNIVTAFKGQMPQWNMSMSPFVDGDKVILCPGGPDAAVVALDAATGRTLWQGGGNDKPGYSTPVAATIGGTKQYLVFTGFALCGVDAQGGKLLWRLPWKTGYDVNAAAPIAIGDDVFITSGYGHGCALVGVAGGEATAKWQNQEIQAHFNSPVLKDGYIYGIGDPGVLVCLDPKTGNTAWKQAGFEKGGLVAVGDALIAMDGKDGNVVLAELTPKQYHELGRIRPLGGQSWTAPIVSDGKLFIRNKSTLACLSLE